MKGNSWRECHTGGGRIGVENLMAKMSIMNNLVNRGAIIKDIEK